MTTIAYIEYWLCGEVFKTHTERYIVPNYISDTEFIEHVIHELNNKIEDDIEKASIYFYNAKIYSSGAYISEAKPYSKYIYNKYSSLIELSNENL